MAFQCRSALAVVKRHVRVSDGLTVQILGTVPNFYELFRFEAQVSFSN
jgi:hypothetical protein